jgi:hypothetical protein
MIVFILIFVWPLNHGRLFCFMAKTPGDPNAGTPIANIHQHSGNSVIRGWPAARELVWALHTIYWFKPSPAVSKELSEKTKAGFKR